MTITKEDLEQWKVHPTTKEVMDIISEMKMDYMKSLSRGSTFNPDSMETTFGNTAKAVGIIEGLDLILNIAVEE